VAVVVEHQQQEEPLLLQTQVQAVLEPHHLLPALQ
jgi:hypothetical protein